jgi:hypothetical protein
MTQWIGSHGPPINRGKKTPAWECVEFDQRSNKLVNFPLRRRRNDAGAVAVLVCNKRKAFLQAGKSLDEKFFEFFGHEEFIGFLSC